MLPQDPSTELLTLQEDTGTPLYQGLSTVPQNPTSDTSQPTSSSCQRSFALQFLIFHVAPPRVSYCVPYPGKVLDLVTSYSGRNPELRRLVCWPC